jgi:hypothetical protein
MSKGFENKRDAKKKPLASFKEKRLKKREKKYKGVQEHNIDQVIE